MRRLVLDTTEFTTPSRELSAAANTDEDVLLISAQTVVPDAAVRLLMGSSVSALTRRGAGKHPVVTAGGRVVTAGTSVHPVLGADSQSVGAIFVPASSAPAASAVLAEAGRRWWVGPAPRDAASSAEPGDVLDAVSQAAGDDASSGRDQSVDPADLALAALVRGGVEVSVVPLEPFPGGRARSPVEADRLRAQIDAADLDQLASRRSSRGQDGFYSTFVLRRLSRPLSRWGASHGVSANAVTALSGVIGVLAAVLFGAGSYAGLLVGALLLQVSLVLDCMDGEIARATQTFSPFGAWLDAASDRVKEYGALAGLAVGAGRHGHDLWLIALAGMVLQTGRHVQDFGFDKGVLAAWRAPRIDRRPLNDLTPFTCATSAAPPERTGASMWVRRVIHLPIAERWLVLSLGALLARPLWSLLGYLGLTVLAAAWALAGALRRSLGSSAPYPGGLRATLGRYRDDGLMTLLLRDRGPGRTAGWLLPVLVTGFEGAVVLVAAAASDYPTRVWASAWFAVVAWHRYDLIYRWRDRALTVPSWVRYGGGGWAVRSVVVLVAAAAGALPAVLAVGTIWLTAVFVPESLRAGVRSRVPTRSDSRTRTPSAVSSAGGA